MDDESLLEVNESATLPKRKANKTSSLLIETEIIICSVPLVFANEGSPFLKTFL